MSRVRDLASILTASSSIATDTEVSAVSAQIPANVAGKNVVINGGFDFWQRNTSAYSGAPTANTPFYFGADRWFYATGTGTNNVRFERTTADTPGLQYGIKYGRNSGASGTAPTILGHVIESVNCKPLNGKTVTVSFYAKKMSNFTGENFFCQLVTGTGTDQGSQQIFIAWAGGAQAGIVTPTLTTTMQRFSFTATIPNGTNQMCVFFPFYTAQPSTAAADEFIQIEGVQLELGSVATPFSRTGGTYSEELAACQRYYSTSIATGFTITDFSGMNQGSSSAVAWCSVGSTNDAFTNIQYPVPMRSAPTFNIYSAGNRTSGSMRDNVTGSDITVSNYSIQAGNNKGFNYMSGMSATSGRPYGFQWTASAEL